MSFKGAIVDAKFVQCTGQAALFTIILSCSGSMNEWFMIQGSVKK